MWPSTTTRLLWLFMSLLGRHSSNITSQLHKQKVKHTKQEGSPYVIQCIGTQRTTT